MNETIDKSVTWYLAGPMSWIPRCNFPLFERVARTLREQGLRIVSPAELDDEETRAAAYASADGRPPEDGPTWGDFLSRDVKLIADEAGGVIMLPEWYRSRGAKLEVFVGLVSDKKFAVWSTHYDKANPVSASYMRHIMQEHMP